MVCLSVWGSMECGVSECAIEESHRRGLGQIGLPRHGKEKSSTSGAITTHK